MMYVACGTGSLHAWNLMWLTSIAIYLALKAVSLCLPSQTVVPGWKRNAYLLAWPGMDLETFVLPVERCRFVPLFSEWGFALLKFASGLMLLLVVAPRALTFDPILAGWLSMIGIAFSLHFGLFHLLSLLWRSFGLRAVPIMDWPIGSQSLSEFWGRRWNRAFRDLTYHLLFRPLSHWIGPSRSMIVGFVISGLVHELVISLPAGGGYGGPTAFFTLQAVGIGVERSPFGRRSGLGRGMSGRIYCAVFLLVPITMLFHKPFICHVLVPFLATIRNAS